MITEIKFISCAALAAATLSFCSTSNQARPKERHRVHGSYTKTKPSAELASQGVYNVYEPREYQPYPTIVEKPAQAPSPTPSPTPKRKDSF